MKKRLDSNASKEVLPNKALMKESTTASPGDKLDPFDAEYINDNSEEQTQRVSEKEFANQLISDADKEDADETHLQGSFKAADGLLSFAGYSVIKDGPADHRRKSILSKVFDGDVKVPNFLTDSVLKQWDQPKSKSRLMKMRNSLNIFKGLMEGRQNPSHQAIDKWIKDIAYIDEVLSSRVEK